MAKTKASKAAVLAVGFDEGDVRRRAFAAWFRTGGTDQPSDDSGVVEVEGKSYVALVNVRGILAVYRVRNDGVLKRLKRWGAAVDAAAKEL